MYSKPIPLSFSEARGSGVAASQTVHFRYAAATGYLGVKAYMSLKLVSFLWKGDVRENERMNKALKLFWQRTPNGSRELSSARATLRHQLGPSQNECLRGKPAKWSTMRPAVDSLSGRLLSAWHEMSSVLGQTDRWAPATIPTDHPHDATVKQMLLTLDPSPLGAQGPYVMVCCCMWRDSIGVALLFVGVCAEIQF